MLMGSHLSTQHIPVQHTGPSPAITGIHLAPRMPLARRRMARKTVVVQPRAAALQDAERAYEFKAQAESAYAAASKLVPAVEDAKRQAAELKLKAEIAERCVCVVYTSWVLVMGVVVYTCV